MSHSYTSNRIHLIFSTKHRAKVISETLQPRLWAYMAEIAKNHGFDTLIVGGVQDHIHALLILPPILPLAKAVQYLKGSSSRWLNEEGGLHGFAWEEGYAAFSVSASQTETVLRYIRGQAGHHAKRTFAQEFEDFLRKYSVDYDPTSVAA